MGQEFSLLNDMSKSNAEIIAMFVATILHGGGDKRSICELCRSLFKAPLVIELGTILDNIDDNLCIPKRSDFGVHRPGC